MFDLILSAPGRRAPPRDRTLMLMLSALTRPSVSVVRLSSRMKSTQLLLATIAVSSSWVGVQLSESFPPRMQRLAPRMQPVQHRSSGDVPSGKSRRISSPLSDHSSSIDGSSSHQSVTGPIYELEGAPSVTLFTKQGCTLCDKVKDVLESLRDVQPHSLHAVDITDADKQHWFSKYKYDIPVLHVNGIFWTKHRLSSEEAVAGIEEARAGCFTSRRGEPDASRFEHN